MIRSGQLVTWLVEARTRTFEVIGELKEDELAGDPNTGFESPRWLLGHLVWYYEQRILGSGGSTANSFYDPELTLYPDRFAPELPPLDVLLPKSAEVQHRVLHAIMEPDTVAPAFAAHVRFAIDHEDWLGEQLIAWMQYLGRDRPLLLFDDEQENVRTSPVGRDDASIAGGEVTIGAPVDDLLSSELERPAYAAEVAPFFMARATVTESEFSAFVEAGGYAVEELWSPEGWRWVKETGRQAPRYWKKEGGHWFRRDFHKWDELDPRRPVSFVSGHEAEAYCRFVGRRLPTEIEWECAASSHETPGERALFPWGDTPFRSSLACLNGREIQAPPVDSYADGVSHLGLRQMLGGVWEWTASTVGLYPGYEAGPEPKWVMGAVGRQRIIRGGSFATPSRFLTCRTRRGLEPGDDRFATGFRTVAR